MATQSKEHRLYRINSENSPNPDKQIQFKEVATTTNTRKEEESDIQVAKLFYFKCSVIKKYHKTCKERRICTSYTEVKKPSIETSWGTTNTALIRQRLPISSFKYVQITKRNHN